MGQVYDAIIDENKLIKLVDLGTTTQSWVGNKVRSYIEGVARSCNKPTLRLFPQIDNLDDKAYSRDEIFNIVNQRKYDSLLCCYLIFAWGGMRRSHANSLIVNPKPLIDLVDMIRNSDIGRDDAYHQFFVLHNSSVTSGLGPAFYTKLLYFFGKDIGWSAYIMDQWTSLSINYLYGDNLIKMDKIIHNGKVSFFVSKKNDQEVYKSFNERIANLANELSKYKQNISITPEVAEIMIFSEGRGKGAWRSFLMDQLKMI